MRTLCFVLLAVIAAPALGQDPPSAPLAVDDEVIVRGRTGSRLRVEIERVEDAVYERFNALNSRDEFDILCSIQTPTGSHLTVRGCLPKFALTAESRAARSIVRGMQAATGGYDSNASLSLMRMDQKGDELLAEMRRLAREDEELMRQLARLVELKEIFGDRVGKRL